MAGEANVGRPRLVLSVRQHVLKDDGTIEDRELVAYNAMVTEQDVWIGGRADGRGRSYTDDSVTELFESILREEIFQEWEF